MLALLLCISVAPGRARTAEDADPHRTLPSLAPVVKKALPGVVSIFALKTTNPPTLTIDPDFQGFPDPPGGSTDRTVEAAGVIIDAARGFVLTNAHVVENAVSIGIGVSDGRRLKAHTIDTDRSTDVAIVRIVADGLAALKMSNSDDLEVGDYVIAVGNPFGVGTTVTHGVISALHRTGPGQYGQKDMIQVDAAVNPGNSGGPVLNLNGEIVGVTTLMIGPGVSYAIPINRIRPIVERIVREHPVERLRQHDLSD